MTEAETKSDDDGGQSSKKKRQLLQNEETARAWSTKCRSKLQRTCSVSLIMIYLLSYFSLSSNPKVSFSDYTYDDVRDAKTGSSPEHAAMRDEHIREQAAQIARIWTPVSPSQWCIDGRLKFEQAKGKPMGLCYLKMPRAASSTLAGINHRISSSFAKRQGIQNCIRHDGPTPAFYFRNRVKGMSFLWTFVRDPTKRAMSRVANGIRKHREDARYTGSYSNNFTDAYILKSLEDSDDIQYGTISEGRGGFQVQYTMLRVLDPYIFWNKTQPSVVQNHADLQQFVKTLLRQYDFIGVVERLDESLVVLQLLMGLETSDILYFSSRLSSQFTRTGGRCIKNIDPQTLRSRAVRDFLQSPTWWAQNYGDWLLHGAASISLDKTIQEIGVQYFLDAYSDFQDMKKEVMENCQPIFPCSKTGLDQLEASRADCYEEDMGCGFPCMDEIATRSITADDVEDKEESEAVGTAVDNAEDNEEDDTEEVENDVTSEGTVSGSMDTDVESTNATEG